MIWKNLKKILAATAVTFALIAGTAVSANADTTGGIGGGGGPGGAYSGFEWVSIVLPKGEAYNKFVELGRWGSQTDAIVNDRIGPNGVGICRDSNVIWFVRSAQGGWTYNYTGATHGPWSGNVAGSIEWARSMYGNRPPIDAEINAFKDWDRGQNGNRIDQVPGYTIICSGKFMQPNRDWNTWESFTSSSSTSASAREPYSWTTSVDPQSLKNSGGKDIIGKDNLHSQTTDHKTEFGKLYDSLNTSGGGGMSPSELDNAVNNARFIDARALNSAFSFKTVDLDAANKEGMAEGGILNVTSRVKWATISTQETTVNTTARSCYYTQTWNSYWAAYNAATVWCSDSTTTKVTRTSSKDNSASPELKGFWQMLSVHCNQEEFNALLASDPSIVKVSDPDPTNSISGVVRSKNYTTMPSSYQLDFGPTAAPAGKPAVNPAKLRTADLGFFDKECPFDCKPTTNTADIVATPGAESNNVKSNIFEFFRDNAAKKVTVNPWVPVDGNGANYNEKPAVTTTVTRDVAGTPSLDGSSGGKFTMNSTKGDELFNGNKTTAPTQKNWDTSTFSGPMASILNGQHNSFNLKSSWASDEGKPQVFNFKWEYKVPVTTKTPVSGIGFAGPDGNQQVGTIGDVTTDIEGKCYTFFGTTNYPDMTAKFGDGTGTGTVNNLDQTLFDGGSSTTVSNLAKMTANFVRSTTE